MLAYILEEPPKAIEGADPQQQHTRGHTIPFVSSEVFSSEIPKVISQFFFDTSLLTGTQKDDTSVNFDDTDSDEISQSNPELFAVMMHFLRNPNLNPVLAGYFEKLFIVIVGIYPRQTFSFMYTTNDGIEALTNMVANLDN